MTDGKGEERRKAGQLRRKQEADRRKDPEPFIWLGPMLERRKEETERRRVPAGRRKSDRKK